jgi:hypothetical protein
MKRPLHVPLLDAPRRDWTSIGVGLALLAFLIVAAWLVRTSPAQTTMPGSGTPVPPALSPFAPLRSAIDAAEADHARLAGEVAALEAQRFAPWPPTDSYFGCISNIADGDAEKALPGELCLGHNVSNRSGLYSLSGQALPITYDVGPLVLRWHAERESARRTGRFRCRAGSLTTVYRRGAIPLQIPDEGWSITLTRPPLLQYPGEPRDYVHPADFPLLLERTRQVFAGEQFGFLDNAAGHERHGFIYTYQQSLDLLAGVAAVGRDIRCRFVFNIVYQPNAGSAGEWAALAAAVTPDHAVMFEWLPADLRAIEPCVRTLLDAGCTVLLSGDPVAGAAWIKATFPPGARLYQCRSPFNNTEPYLAHFRR